MAGQSLSSLVVNEPRWLLGEEFVDAAGGTVDRFPLLLKYLDCNRDLSVQVHPDDRYAATLDPPDLGKTEAWVVVDAQPGSQIYAGLKSGVGRDDLAAAMRSGRTEEVLHRFEPSAGDCVFIPAGTVHALGAGLVIAEIQQSSDTTFRLFDWNRTDSTGQSRPLHLEQSLEVSDYRRGPVNAQPPVATGQGFERLVDCDKFVLRRITAPLEIAGDDRCHLLTLPAGRASVRAVDGEWSLTAGESLLLPAAIGPVRITTDGPLLWMSPTAPVGDIGR